MMKLLSLAAVAFAISAVSAVEITFVRYSRQGCGGPTEHIAADTHLEDPKCKSFDTDEPAFYSFMIKPEDDGSDLNDKYCEAIIFDGEDCKGHAFTVGDMNDNMNTCANTPIPGRSVRISCDQSLGTRTRTMAHTQTRIPAETPCNTDSTRKARPTTTLTLVPTREHDDYSCEECDDF